jgi:hypothetical protein
MAQLIGIRVCVRVSVKVECFHNYWGYCENVPMGQVT